jgi:uncharacterized cysteine cluster protein YcgN (CxxCxxCC family)
MKTAAEPAAGAAPGSRRKPRRGARAAAANGPVAAPGEPDQGVAVLASRDSPPPAPAAGGLPFWRRKTLAQMTRAEWESLCDGCGRCCLHKLRDADTGRLHHTNVACRLLDLHACRCSDYAHRQARVPDCVRLTPARVARLDWLPSSCAYRLLQEGKDLPPWHPLVCGDPEAVHRAGASVRGRAVPERAAGRLVDHVVRWPGLWPRGWRDRQG